MDPLQSVFLFCLVFGFTFTVGSVGFGGLRHHRGSPRLHGARGGRLGGARGRIGRPSAPRAAPTRAHRVGGRRAGLRQDDSLSPFNFSSLMVFVTFFGGIGFVLNGPLGAGPIVALGFAGLAGIFAGLAVFWFMSRVLMKNQDVLDPSDFDREGTVARVLRTIGADRSGEIIYSQVGSRFTDGARSADGRGIAKGEEVVIVGFDRGIAVVEPWASYCARYASEREGTLVSTA